MLNEGENMGKIKMSLYEKAKVRVLRGPQGGPHSC
jgi:hypothetical protein